MGSSGQGSSRLGLPPPSGPVEGWETLVLRPSVPQASRGLECVDWEQVVVGGCGEVELFTGSMVVAWAAEPQRPLKVQQLPHEVEVGRDVRLFPFNEVIGIVEGQVHLLHQVGYSNCHGTADACQAVHQDTTLLGAGFIDEADGLREELREVLTPVVRDGDLLVGELATMLKGIGQVGCDIEDIFDAVLAKYIQVGRVLGTAEVEVGQDLDREGWLAGRHGAAIRLSGTAGQLPV